MNLSNLPLHSVQNVKRTNGRISFENRVQEAWEEGDERLGDHGLFGDEDNVNLNTAMSELEHYTRKRVDAHHLSETRGRRPAGFWRPSSRMRCGGTSSTPN